MESRSNKHSIVFCHGIWADGSSFSKVIPALQADFSEVRKPLLDPAPGHVRVRVEACGVCHSDTATVEGLFPINWPRVPGHEVVGRMD